MLVVLMIVALLSWLLSVVALGTTVYSYFRMSQLYIVKNVDLERKLEQKIESLVETKLSISEQSIREETVELVQMLMNKRNTASGVNIANFENWGG